MRLSRCNRPLSLRRIPIRGPEAVGSGWPWWSRRVRSWPKHVLKPSPSADEAGVHRRRRNRERARILHRHERRNDGPASGLSRHLVQTERSIPRVLDLRLSRRGWPSVSLHGRKGARGHFASRPSLRDLCLRRVVPAQDHADRTNIVDIESKVFWAQNSPDGTVAKEWRKSNAI